MKLFYKRSLALIMALVIMLGCTSVAFATDSTSAVSNTIVAEKINELSPFVARATDIMVDLELKNGCSSSYRTHDTVSVNQSCRVQAILGVSGSMELVIAINNNQVYKNTLSNGTYRVDLGWLSNNSNISYSLNAVSSCSYVRFIIGGEY